MDANLIAGPAKSRGGCRQVSLRNLLLLMSLLCICLSWFAVRIDAARRQYRAVAEILNVGGTVAYDYQLDGKAQPPGPHWLRELLGDDFFCNVTSVHLSGALISESGFARLADLPMISDLVLTITRIVPDDGGDESTVDIDDAEPFAGDQSGIITAADRRPINDHDLMFIGRFSRRVNLRLENSAVDGSGLKYLANLKCINSLSLGEIFVDDSGMEAIGKLTTLKNLSLDKTRVTDAGMMHLTNLTHLETLSLNGTEISEIGLRFLNSKRITGLLLSNTHIGDAAMQQVGKLKNLECLVVGFTGITDAGLENLKSLTNLQALELFGTDISDQ